MPYASLQEAWAMNNMPNETKINNHFVVPNPNKTQTNLDNFFDRFYKDTNKVINNQEDESYDPTSKYKRFRNNNSIEVSDPAKSTYRKRQKWCKPKYTKRYFVEDDLSTISNPEIDVYSEDSNVSRGSDIMKKVIGKKMTIQKKEQKEHKTKNVREHFANLNSCEGILEHLNKCEICKAQVEMMNKNTFIKEFIIFATSGILMFIFLELIYKIAKRQ